MQLVLLVEEKMKPLPQNVKVVKNFDEPEGMFGKTSIHGSNGENISGDHMILEASEETFKDWLRGFDGVWVGKGSPQMQSFEVMHIK